MKGQCLCGAVTVEVTGDPAGWVGACHCGMCRRWSGGLFLCFAAAADAVTVAGPVGRFASSEFAERAFCTACGTHLWMRDTAEGADYDLMPGLFADTLDWPLRSEIYTDIAPAAVQLKGEHPRATRAAYEAKHPHVEGDLT